MAKMLNILKRIKQPKLQDGSALFTYMDILFVSWSIITFFTDIGTDIIVTVKYFNHGHYFWAFMTVCILVAAGPIIQFFSIQWCLDNGKVTKCLWIWHFTGLGVLRRYLVVLKTGLKMRKINDFSQLEFLLQQQSDVCMLRLFETFLESAPQLVLQIYIMIATNHWSLWTSISALASLISLSWAIAAYSKAMRSVRVDKANISWVGLILQTVWRVGMVSARVSALAIFALAFKFWIFIFIAIHWICAFIWITFQKTDFCTTWWEERIYNCVVAGIYCFCFFNLKEGKTRYRISVFYIITISENILLTLGAYLHFVNIDEIHRFWLLQLGVLIIIFSTIIGLSAMVLYYRFFHPIGPITLTPCVKDAKPKLQESGERNRTSDICGSIAVRNFKSHRTSLQSAYELPEVHLELNPASLQFDYPVRSIPKFHGSSCSVPCFMFPTTSLRKINSLPNLNICDSISPMLSAKSGMHSSELNFNHVQDESDDSGVNNVPEHNVAATNQSDNLSLDEVIAIDFSQPHYEKLLFEQSPKLKEIKSKLGHSISFGDIPLFPPSRRKLIS